MADRARMDMSKQTIGDAPFVQPWRHFGDPIRTLRDLRHDLYHYETMRRFHVGMLEYGYLDGAARRQLAEEWESRNASMLWHAALDLAERDPRLPTPEAPDAPTILSLPKLRSWAGNAARILGERHWDDDPPSLLKGWSRETLLEAPRSVGNQRITDTTFERIRKNAKLTPRSKDRPGYSPDDLKKLLAALDLAAPRCAQYIRPAWTRLLNGDRQMTTN